MISPPHVPATLGEVVIVVLLCAGGYVTAKAGWAIVGYRRWWSKREALYNELAGLARRVDSERRLAKLASSLGRRTEAELFMLEHNRLYDEYTGLSWYLAETDNPTRRWRLAYATTEELEREHRRRHAWYRRLYHALRRLEKRPP